MGWAVLRRRVPGALHPVRLFQDRRGGAAAERLRGRAARAIQRHAGRRLPHPGPVRRRDPLPALAQGARDRHPRAGLHHPRQRAGRESTASCTSRCWTRSARPTASATTSSRSPSSPRRRCAARSARSSSTAPSRSARTSTSRSSASSTRRPSLGRQGAALRDQEHHAAQDVLAAMEKQMRAEREKRAAILTSEGERDAAINTAEGAEAAGHQGVGGQEAAADQRGRRSGRGDPRRRQGDRRGHPHGGGGDPARRAASRPCSSASPSST